MAVAEKTIRLTVEDFTGQMRHKASGVPRDASMGDLIASVASKLRLPLNDSQGRPVTYGARAHGVALNESDRIGEVLTEDEVVTLTQNVTAG